MKISRLLWPSYFVFLGLAVYWDWHPRLFSLAEPFAAVKLLIWAVYVLFLAYSLYCSTKEDLLETIGKVGQLHWGRQIGADLYIGLSLSLVLVYLHQGPIAALLWMVPTLLFGNLSILLYFSLHFDALVSRLAA